MASIINHTNEYQRQYRKLYPDITITDVFKYISVLIDSRAFNFHDMASYYKDKGKHALLPEYRFDDITSILQMNEYFLYTQDEATAEYVESRQWW